MRVRRALVSVHDKTGIGELAQALSALGVEILSTGGTAKLIREAGVPVVDVSDATGFPEMLDGRVKTLHPKIHGGILARRDVPEHLAALAKQGIAPIDLVVVALYPFELTVARPGVTQAEAIEQIDVGGSTMIRAAAMKQLHRPELGYNNLLDFSAALSLLLEFAEPAAIVIKHTNPCGAARAATVGGAMALAKASDPVSIYGGIVGVNRILDAAVVQALAGVFVEILFAPSFAPGALEEIKRTKKKCRVFEISCDRPLPARLPEYRGVLGGLLVQTTDLADLEPANLKTVSKRAPTAAELDALRFAWRVGKHAKSNAIVLTTREQVIGVGAGQMNRVDSARLAVMRAREIGLETTGTVCASDAFFPFRDGLDVVARAGATAVIQPGGSLRDEEVIAAADEQGLAMIFTGVRHFRH